MGSHVVGPSGQAKGKSLKFKVYSERAQGRSYAAVVDGNCNKDSYDLSIKRETVDKNANWLSNNMVGIVKWERIIPSIPSICDAYGIRGIKIVRLGGLKVLLSFPNLEHNISILRAFKFDFDQVFS